MAQPIHPKTRRQKIMEFHDAHAAGIQITILLGTNLYLAYQLNKFSIKGGGYWLSVSKADAMHMHVGGVMHYTNKLGSFLVVSEKAVKSLQ